MKILMSVLVYLFCLSSFADFRKEMSDPQATHAIEAFASSLLSGSGEAWMVNNGFVLLGWNGDRGNSTGITPIMLDNNATRYINSLMIDSINNIVRVLGWDKRSVYFYNLVHDATYARAGIKLTNITEVMHPTGKNVYCNNYKSLFISNTGKVSNKVLTTNMQTCFRRDPPTLL